jgi:hypothetical protein
VMCAGKQNIGAGVDGVRRLNISIKKPLVSKEFCIMRSKNPTP